MKHRIILVNIILLFSVGTIATAQAEQSITAGYSISRVQDFKNIKGFNAKYRYEWDENDPFSFIASFTYQKGSGDTFHTNNENSYWGHNSIKYYSLLAGPAYRFNPYFSAYLLFGANLHKVDYTESSKTYDYSLDTYSETGPYSGNAKKIYPAYGVGIQINPTPNWVIDINYESSLIKYASKNYFLNGVNLGVGFRF